MFLSVYRFQGEPSALLAGHARLLETIPASSVQLNASVARPDGLDVYDSCPSRAVFEAFSSGPGFAEALAHAGLPSPRIEPLGEIGTLVLQGHRIF